MALLWALIVSLLFSFHNSDKPLTFKDGNITTTIINGQIYKSAESKIGQAWISE